MSSTPFCLGMPVIDEPVEEGEFVLRGKNANENRDKLIQLRNKLRKNDLIAVYHIGFRPDKPVPVAMYFDEVHIHKDLKESETSPWRFPFFNALMAGVN